MRSEPIHPFTVLASVLMLTLTLPFTLAAWSMWEASAGPLDPATYDRLVVAGIDTGFRDLFGRALSRADAQFWVRASGVFLGMLCAFSAALTAGVGLRREWARHTAIVLFLLFALISVPLALGGMVATPRPGGLASAALAAVGSCLVLALLATGQVADDIARGTFYRERRRRRRPDDTAGRASGDDRDDPPVLAA